MRKKVTGQAVFVVILMLGWAYALSSHQRTITSANEEMDRKITAVKQETRDPCQKPFLRIVDPPPNSSRHQVIVIGGEEILSGMEDFYHFQEVPFHEISLDGRINKRGRNLRIYMASTDAHDHRDLVVKQVSSLKCLGIPGTTTVE